MLVNKNKVLTPVAPQPEKPSAGKRLTMQEAMDYLSDKGVPCRSRATFYRILNDFDVQYVNINPNGKNEIRRFKQEDLDKILDAKGLDK